MFFSFVFYVLGVVTTFSSGEDDAIVGSVVVTFSSSEVDAVVGSVVGTFSSGKEEEEFSSGFEETSTGVGSNREDKGTGVMAVMYADKSFLSSASLSAVCGLLER